ncbi:hypothetical protein Fcan01_19825 [Folsomia candida]|uniref:Uncharacterized protein n=1 Tax=Folsomia candida TaxID=158441 RepID=A0A226DME6_FOLCA|nr:hypothetical protein Fcan01_19825 [Folsomia candida]
MMDDQTLNTICIFVKATNLFNGTPYEWNHTEKCLRLSFNFKKRICVSLTKWNIWIYLTFLIVRLAGEILDTGHHDFVAVIWLLIWIFEYVWCAISFQNAQASGSIAIALFKGVKKLYEEMSAKYPDQMLRKPIFLKCNSLQIKLMAVLWILANLISAVCLMFLVAPLKPQYISSLFEQGVQNPLIYAGFILLETYSKGSAAMGSGIDGIHTLVPIMNVTLDWEAWVVDGLAKKSRASIRQKIQDYRTINILVAAFNHSVTKYLVSYLCCWGPGGFVLIAGFATIRFHGQVNMFEYAPFPIILQNCLILVFLGVLSTSSVGMASQKLLSSMKQQSRLSGPSKIIAREMKALQMFGIEAGYWITNHGSCYLGLKSTINLETYPDNLYFLLVPDSPKILLATKSPLYSQPFRYWMQTPVRFSVVLFFKENMPVVCHQKNEHESMCRAITALQSCHRLKGPTRSHPSNLIVLVGMQSPAHGW